MALLPYALRPSVVIRRKAIRQGILGPSRLWKLVAAMVFGRGTIKKVFGKSRDQLGTVKVKSNSFVNVINVPPMSKKQAKAAGVTKQLLISRASADVAASWAQKAQDKPTHKNRRRAQHTADSAAVAHRKATKKASKQVS